MRNGDQISRRQVAAWLATLDLSFSDNVSLQRHLSALDEDQANEPLWRHFPHVSIAIRLTPLQDDAAGTSRPHYYLAPTLHTHFICVTDAYSTGSIVGENAADYKYYKSLAKPT